MANVYGSADADIAGLRGRRIAVLGYGSQGRSHALNLRDSGMDVIVAQRAGSPRFEDARRDGFEATSIEDAVAKGDLIVFALPDEKMGDIYAAQIRDGLRAGQTLGFIHGFAIRYELIVPRADVDVIMVAPKGPGPLVRDAFVRGGGVAAIFAIHQDVSGGARKTALAWGAGIGAARVGMIEATFAQECESDLFGEQTVLTGGVIELMKAAYETLVEAGYPAELAYFECIHELKQIVDMQYVGGLDLMRSKISRTAAYGGLTRGPRLVSEETRVVLREILAEIRSGSFAREWVEENRGDSGRLTQLLSEESRHESEAAGRLVRGMSQR
jgi:ketol-acid reductoisomerase